MIEAKRREIKDMMEDNSKSYKDAIYNQQILGGSRVRGRSFQPEPTMPEGPYLHTSHRCRSTSSQRSASSPSRPRSMSRHRFPREQAAIERHLNPATVPQSPARSVASERSDTSLASARSRLTQLSQR